LVWSAKSLYYLMAHSEIILNTIRTTPLKNRFDLQLRKRML
jgi:hypothetical protein